MRRLRGWPQIETTGILKEVKLEFPRKHAVFIRLDSRDPRFN